MLELEIKIKNHIVYISVLNQTKFGTDFNDGFYYFRASNGFILHSCHDRSGIGVRLAKFYVSAVDNNDPTVSEVPLTCGANKYYIKGLIQAVKEYNERN